MIKPPTDLRIVTDFVQVPINETVRPEEFYLPDGQGGYTVTEQQVDVDSYKGMRKRVLKGNAELHCLDDRLELYIDADLAAVVRIYGEAWKDSQWRDRQFIFGSADLDYKDAKILRAVAIQAVPALNLSNATMGVEIEWSKGLANWTYYLDLAGYSARIRVVADVYDKSQIKYSNAAYSGTVDHSTVDQGTYMEHTWIYEPSGFTCPGTDSPTPKDGLLVDGPYLDIQEQEEHNEYEITLGETAANLRVGSRGPKFVPNVNISWECFSGAEKYFLNLNRKDVTVGTETESFANNEIDFPDFGDVWKTVVDDDGQERLAWDIEFATDPRNGGTGDYVIDWELLSHPDMAFHWQPPLTQDEIDRGATRPLDVVGSYAVYCERSNNYNDVKYYTGKLCHIYRPKCIDAMDNEVWADLTIDADLNLFRIVIPGSYLDIADFPVRLDPELGHNFTTGSEEGTFSYDICVHDTSGAAGTVDDVNVYLRNAGSTERYCKVAIFDDEASCPEDKLSGGVQSFVIAASAGAQWYQEAYTGDIAASTKYWVCFHQNSAEVKVKYDSLTDGAAYDSANYNAAFGDGKAWTDCLYDRKYSVYANYTVAAAALTVNVSDSFTAAEALD